MVSPADPPPRSLVRDVRFPPPTGSALGWVGLAMVAVALYLDLTRRSGARALEGALGLLLVGVLVYAVVVRPRVRIRDDVLVLINPFGSTCLPLRRISSLRVRTTTTVTADGRRYRGLGIGRTRIGISQSAGGGSSVRAATTGFVSPNHNAAQMLTPMGSKRGALDPADLLEDTVDGALAGVTDRERTHAPPVTRDWAWPVIVPVVVLAGALLASLVLA